MTDMDSVKVRPSDEAVYNDLWYLMRCTREEIVLIQTAFDLASQGSFPLSALNKDSPEANINTIGAIVQEIVDGEDVSRSQSLHGTMRAWKLEPGQSFAYDRATQILSAVSDSSQPPDEHPSLSRQQLVEFVRESTDCDRKEATRIVRLFVDAAETPRQLSHIEQHLEKFIVAIAALPPKRSAAHLEVATALLPPGRWFTYDTTTHTLSVVVLPDTRT